MSDDLSNLVHDLQNAPQRIARQVAGRMVRAQRELLGVARSVVHVRTGELRDSLYIVAPVYLTDVLSEWGVGTTSDHGQYEIDRGGPHDYVAQTLEAGAAIIDETADDLAEITAQAIVGSD